MYQYMQHKAPQTLKGISQILTNSFFEEIVRKKKEIGRRKEETWKENRTTNG